MIGTRASVPMHSPQFRRQPSATASSPFDETEKTPASARPMEPDCGLSGRITYTWAASQSTRRCTQPSVHRGRAGAAERPVPERQLAKGGMRRSRMHCGDERPIRADRSATGCRREPTSGRPRQRWLRTPGSDGAATSASTAAVTTSSSSRRASPMSRSRRFGSFCRQRRNRSRMRGGTDAGSASQSTSRSRTRAMVSEMVSPPNAERPVSISKRRSQTTRCPFACRDSCREPVRDSYKPASRESAADRVATTSRSAFQTAPRLAHPPTPSPARNRAP